MSEDRLPIRRQCVSRCDPSNRWFNRPRIVTALTSFNNNYTQCATQQQMLARNSLNVTVSQDSGQSSRPDLSAAIEIPENRTRAFPTSHQNKNK